MFKKYINKSINPQIITIISEIYEEFNLYKTSRHINNFCKIYAQKNTSEIDWIEMCIYLKKYPCHKFAIKFLVKLLELNLYEGSYSDILYNKLDMLKIIAYENNRLHKLVFCEEKINELIIFKNNSQGQIYSYAFITSKNYIIGKYLFEFLDGNDRNCLRWCNLDFLYHFENSFCQYIDVIKNYKDFNSNTFFIQISYYKNLYKNNKNAYNSSITGITVFYRWLCNTFNEYDFFANSFNMSKSLLFSGKLTELIRKDYYFTTFNPLNHPGPKTKICFLIKGLSHISTRITNDDWNTIDISIVKNEDYRNMILSFILSSTSSTMLKDSTQILYINEALKFLIELKEQTNYPNKNLKYMTNQEAILIRNYINSFKISIGTKNNRIGAIRRFFIYTKNNNLINFDDIFFDYLRQYEEPTKNNAKAVPDDKLVLINNNLLEKAKKSHLAKLIYSIFHLTLQTEFRINQICHLKVDCIKPSIKPNQYIICTNSKTSHGTIESYVITDITYHLLMNIIDDTEDFRDNCNIESLKDYIFLYKGRTNTPTLITNDTFGKYIKKICNELGFHENYTASNFRDTHMTKAFEHILRNGKSDIEMGVLSNHRHIDTTKNHYIEMELEKMLEATYGIIIGEEYIETESKIIDKIPDEFKSKENDVENGCGKCTAKKCEFTSSLPCLACKYFITTTNHEIFFKKSINNIDRIIEKTLNKHDKEDLITIKQLYVLYLKAIYKYKEKNSNG
ncbi:tyrosine-type recombinase/integrase [Clostridium perfringens]|uniref:site-specific integrase n=1 Tax=Clostridium perfringens TaxID=1502 RepID=UPI002858BEF9|nr:site-specific integrase [Clostridium perfringens]ELC8389504.1 site-specific integrase [Clostridium perfringens]MCI5748147.1 site-specific integrase [Clostridium perfringens]MDY4420731.1 site-specific integrase [Clostridium perfringens]MDZ5017871.1 tyrosine-type recombinase/integrase [Clostridium perfringens]